MADIKSVLADREMTHGPFAPKSVFIQDTKADFRDMPLWHELHADQQEALDMIVTKIGRILTGDANTTDHWTDLAGYSQLVVDRLDRDRLTLELPLGAEKTA